ncbi:TetR/AcrR family transcriptional regulator [Pseudonocardiaceae bacterium YIM PH 21723]|nr:TetR/AcrR family transcriptional regulator [Pseudonocardiaceae bacterium YIM PH 21723]
MTVKRHMPERTDEEKILDAARECVLERGVTATTLTAVARRAGVSRMTLYRRWPDARALVMDLITRDLLSLVDMSMIRSGMSRAEAIDTAIRAARDVQAHPLFRKIVEVDPDLLIDYIFRGKGQTSRGFLAIIEEGLRVGQSLGTVRDADRRVQARVMLLGLQAFALSAGSLSDDEVSTDELAGEFAVMLDRYLEPRR